MVILSVVEWKKRERAVKRKDQKGEKIEGGDRREKGFYRERTRRRRQSLPFPSFLLLF